MNKAIAHAKVIASAAVTWLVLIATLVTTLAHQLAELMPNGTIAGMKIDDIVAALLRTAAWLGGAVAIIRRVTPVEADARGVLPRVVLRDDLASGDDAASPGSQGVGDSVVDGDVLVENADPDPDAA